MVKQKKQLNRQSNRAVTVWLDETEWERLNALVERLRLDRSKVLKFIINDYSPNEVVSRYIESLTPATPRNGAEGAP